MQTECVRCHKMIDTVQGYKFSPTEYVCMSCYDEFKAERVAKARKEHKNPLLDQYGEERQPAAGRPAQPGPAAPPQQPRQRPAAPPPQAQQPAAPERPRQPAPSPPQQPAPPTAPEQQMFAPRQPARPAGPARPAEPAGTPAAPVGTPKAPAPKAPVPKAPPSADVCDVCQKPISDFKVPLTGGKKVCMGCNDLLRDVAKSLVQNVRCPHCGKDIQLAE